MKKTHRVMRSLDDYIDERNMLPDPDRTRSFAPSSGLNAYFLSTADKHGIFDDQDD